jgi:PAS domain S-box-containing protein
VREKSRIRETGHRRKKCILWVWEAPPVIELSRYVLEALRRDEEFILYRGRSQDDPSQVLVLSPVAEYLRPDSLKRLEHAYSLREELDPAWAARPIGLARHRDRIVLVLEDRGDKPLDQFGGFGEIRPTGTPAHALDLGFCLRIGINLANAIGQLHRRGIVHKDIKPANVLVNSATGRVWLMGFGIASRLPRQRQSPDSPEFLEGTFAYMSPEQTGRMNRSIDSRSDLYSLGVTLYEMLTGSLPFTASDPMEWVHCHIARKPVPPCERLKNVPLPISAIIMKMLAKTAEERYLTAAGVESDLRRCLADWETRGRIEEFPLGEHDTPDRLLIPEKLYGRRREIETLLASFERVVASGRPELVLVSGYSGIGKSSVVNELHKVLVPTRGLFASGKFDQYKRDIPYATLGQAFQSLIRPFLGKSEAELNDWREAFREALGPNGRLMVDLVPELKLIIGEQLPLPDLPPQDAQGRFQLVFQRFIRVFARPEHPLALFLDDLQWLDAATLDLLEDLLTRTDVRHLMLIGAYRDNEVSSAHPLMRKLEAIRNSGAVVREIILAPLTEGDLRQLISDSLRCQAEPTASLAQLVFEKTAGNPFFAIQFISALAEEGLLTFDHSAMEWSWDRDRIHAKGYTDNVVDLMVEKLNRLSVKTQKALQLFACIGNSAEDVLLETAYEGLGKDLHDDIWEAVRNGLVFRTEGAYRFLHDRVQEAAYSLIPEVARRRAHLQIGRLLASRTEPAEIEGRAFEIVNQLNRGSHLITSPVERTQVAGLNLIAGRRARLSTAYASAIEYLTAGRALLTEGDWKHNYELIFGIEYQLAECELLTASTAAAEQRLSLLAGYAERVQDIAAVARLRLTLYTTLDRTDRGVEVCLEYLRRGGTDWSPHPTRDQAQREYDKIWSQLGSRSIESIVELPLMTDPDALAELEVLTEMVTTAEFTDENLLLLVICRMVNLSLEHGNSDGSCFAYIYLGMIAGERFGSYGIGVRLGRLGYDLVEQRGLRRFQARTYLSLGDLVIPWTKHVRTARDLIHRAFDTANQIGDLTFAAYSCFSLNANLLATGDPLVDTHREAEKGLEFVQRTRFGLVIDTITAQLYLIRTLRGLTSKFGCFNDAHFDEHRFERHLTDDPRLAFAECRYWIRKLQARFLAADYAAAIQASSNAQGLLWTSRFTLFEGAEYEFYSALSHAAVWDSAKADERQHHFKAVTAHHKQLGVWAANCPENFVTRVALVSAEIARIEGRDLDAMHFYEQAIRCAQENGFIHIEGVANEAAARFYLARGFERIASAYLREARYCYLRWEATGKVRQLDQIYPQLGEEEPGTRPAGTIGASVEHLDLATVIKVSQTVSGQIVLEKLIDTLMRIAIEHAGADRGLLILPHEEGLLIAAEAKTGRDGIDVQQQDALVTPSDLPDSLLRYVVRTQESVILDDATVQNLFSEDEYVRRQGPRSILCLPLMKQAKLMGVLYLENKLAPRVFTPKRLTMLDLMASQAAISLEHARLYAGLGRLNAELTKENSDRKKAEEALRTSEERLQDIVDNTTAVIFVKDLGLHYLLVNSEFERRHQLQRDQIRGKTDFDIHPYEVAEAVRANDRQVIEAGVPIQFEEAMSSAEGERSYVSVKFLLRDRRGKPYAVCGIATDITESKRAEAMQAAMARERELFAQHRATELAKANEALRGCLDALVSVPELDDFLGQVMAVITRHLGAVSSTSRVLNLKQNTLTMELLFQDGRVMSPAEANFPESWRSLSLDKQRAAAFLDQPTAVARLLDPDSPIPEALRSYLLGQGIKTLLIIPLSLGGQANGQLSFRFTDERDFDPEELEIARALATQASLAIHLTRLAKTARQSAVLEERNQLAGEIHDSLAQFFTGITMQLGAAREVINAGSGDALSYLERACDLAQFGLAEARRSAFSLQPTIIEELGLVEALQKLVERSNIPGRLRCNFYSTSVPEESLPSSVQQDLLRIAQEAMSNAVRHAKPTVISVNLRCQPPNVVLEVTDNGSGIANSRAVRSKGFGFSNMRARAENIGAQLEVRSAAGRGTTIVVHVPMNF